jgi:hypothetical protein
LYATTASEVPGNKVLPCVAELPIRKKNPDESIYTTWRGTGGVRIYKSLTDTTPLSITEQEMFFTVEKPDFTKEIVDPKKFAAFDSIAIFDEDEAEVETETQPLDALGGEKTLDASALGFSGTAKQSVLASFEVVADLAEPDNINFLFIADIPRAAIYESAIIYQWAQLTPKTNAIGEISIDCKVQVGNSQGTNAGVYKAKIEDSSVSGKAWHNTGAAAHDTLKATYIKDDIEFYELGKSDTDKVKNQVQKCLA